MKALNNIPPEDLTEFLTHGAFVRDGAQVHFMEGPFSPGQASPEAMGLSVPLFYQADQLHFLKPHRSSTLSLREALKWVQKALEIHPPTPTSWVWQKPLLSEYEKAFSIVQNLMAEGQIEKAVPVMFETAPGEVSAAHKLEWLLHALQAPTSLVSFGFWQGPQGLIATSPEILFDVQGPLLKTMALAGTLSRTEGTAQDLLRSQKNNQEHQFVVDDLCAQLKNFGDVQTAPRNILELPTLFHLQTKIEVTLHERPDYQRLMAHLHPTPALGVSPRVFGWRWMSELPGQKNRQHFGAPVTWFLAPDRVLSVLSIRGLEWSAGQLSIGSGGGVVKGSELTKEWQELTHKRESVKKIFHLSPFDRET